MGGYKALVSAGCPGDRGERGLGLQETYNVIHMYISSGMKKIIIIIKKSGSNNVSTACPHVTCTRQVPDRHIESQCMCAC